MRFVIWADPFDDRVGGRIVLHSLCAALNAAGHVAKLWPAYRPRMIRHWRDAARAAKWHLRDALPRPFSYGPYGTGPFGNALAGNADLANSIVVYPEVVRGNPLLAKHVVRWLLHRPGFHTGHVEFGAGDLVFYYQDAFRDVAAGGTDGGRLQITWWNDAYRDRALPGRHGSAYLIKKGHGRPLVHDLSDSTLVDDLSHAERAAVFNRVLRFYTYDPYTLYSRYAAICGAVPIIVPEPGVTKETWIPVERERYGLAYGEKEIEWAVETRPLLMEQIDAEKREEREMLDRFVALCVSQFG